MGLPEILIVMGAGALVSAHLFIINRWLRDETEPRATGLEPERNQFVQDPAPGRAHPLART